MGGRFLQGGTKKKSNCKDREKLQTVPIEKKVGIK